MADRARICIPASKTFTNAATAVRGIDNECLEILCSYRWPGNVLQLRNVIERATPSPVAHSSLPPIYPPMSDAPVARALSSTCVSGDSLDNVEREFILKTLDFTHGNKVRAADILGVSLKTLYNRLDRYQGKKRDSADPSTELNDS